MRTSDPTFRMALGVDIAVPVNASSPLQWLGGISLPSYFVFASKDTSLHKGLVRISPAVTHRGATTSDTAFSHRGGRDGGEVAQAEPVR